MEYTESHIKLRDDFFANPPPKEIPEIPVFQALDDRVSKSPDRTAVISFGKEMSFKELKELTDRFAAALVDLGVKKGDRVATMLPNSINHLIVYFGIIRTGAIAVPLNVMYTPKEVLVRLKDIEAKIIVVLDIFYPVVEEIKEKGGIEKIIVSSLGDFMPKIKSVLGKLLGKVPKYSVPKKPEIYNLMDLLKKYPPEPPKVEIDPKEDVQLMIYTAGTTGGAPKAAMLTHYNFIYEGLHINAALPVDENDITMVLYPMFHISGYILFLLPTLLIGGIAIFYPRFDAQEYLKLIDKYRVTLFLAPQTVYVAFMNQSNFKKYDVSSLKFVGNGGMPLAKEVADRWYKETGLALNNGWGLTETTAGVCASPPGDIRIDTIGGPFVGEVKIVDEEGKTVKVTEAGEILVKGPHVMKGYYKRPEVNKQVFTEDRWLRTGDAGFIDKDGYLHFVDRIKDLIVASAYKIAPSEVEDVLMEHPAVNEVGVIGVPDPYRGQNVKAFISLRDEYKDKVTEEEIIEWSKEKMAAYKYPRIVEFIDEIPKHLMTQKVLRSKLREMEKEKK